MIALVLTHNKGDQGNVDQIDAALNLLTRTTEEFATEEGETYEVSHYEFTDLPGHKVLPMHIVPFGVTRPSNIDTLDGHKVLFGAGDEDKVGDHPQFFNWGLKRGTDLGADIVIHVRDAQALTKDWIECLLLAPEPRMQYPFGIVSRKDDIQVEA